MRLNRRAFTCASFVLLTVIGTGCGEAGPRVGPESPSAEAPFPGSASSSAASSAASPASDRDYISGRVVTFDGSVYEGRLRFGGDEEAFWSDHFNGFKGENPWAAHAPPEALRERRPLEIFGIEVPGWNRRIDLDRPFLVRLGDIARIEPFGRDLRVTLKSGTVFHLDRYAADDFADGVRVWDAERGIVDLEEPRIRSITFPGSFEPGETMERLHGTVRTGTGEFTGFLQWDREEGVASDELDGLEEGTARAVPFDSIAAIARRSSDSVLVRLRDGRELVLSGHRNVGEGNRGIYVDDPRYGRVLVSWDAFERVDLSPGGRGLTYADFPPGRPLRGTVITRDGRRLQGRLVYDLDESETTETLDASAGGVDFMIPFGQVSSIVLSPLGETDADHALILLDSGQELRLERSGDLDDGNAGLLIFMEGRDVPGYVEWSDVERIDLESATP